MAKQRVPTPLEYVHFLAGWPPPENEPEVQGIPVPTPVYMPNPRMIDEQALFGDPMNPFDTGGAPVLPPPIAPPPPPGFSGMGGGMMVPKDGPFG